MNCTDTYLEFNKNLHFKHGSLSAITKGKNVIYSSKVRGWSKFSVSCFALIC